MKICLACGRQNPDDFSLCPECGEALRMRTASPEELLERVIDRDTFIEFVTALAEEREEAERMERTEPVNYQMGGAHNWQNASISSYLHASLAYFESKPQSEPSWKMLAEMLYVGKIYE